MFRFQVGVLGATGFIGSPYRAEIREAPDDATIVALCARGHEKLQAAAREDRATLVTDDWRRVVEHPDVNLVVIATPDALHYEAVMACAAAGKHVVCEKPVSMDSRQAAAMWSAYRRAGLGHFVPYWTRYVSVFIRAREVIKAGDLGEIRAAVYRWHNPRPLAMPFTWRDDAALSAAGSVADVGSHAYDTLRWLIDQEAECVLAHADVITPAKPDLGTQNLEEALRWGQEHAVGHSSIPGDMPLRRGTAFDYASVAFKLPNGAVGSLILSHAPYLRKGLAPEVELHGTKASLAIDRIGSKLTIVRQGENPAILDTIPDPGFGNRFKKHVFPALRKQISGEVTQHPDLHDGWRVQLFTEAAARSAREGGWISIADLAADDA